MDLILLKEKRCRQSLIERINDSCKRWKTLFLNAFGGNGSLARPEKDQPANHGNEQYGKTKEPDDQSAAKHDKRDSQ